MKVRSVTMPVTVGYDRSKVIGYITLDEEQLPKTPDYVFAIGGKIDKAEADGVITKFELLEVSLVMDDKYRPMKDGKLNNAA